MILVFIWLNVKFKDILHLNINSMTLYNDMVPYFKIHVFGCNQV